jgi:glycosyltransferase involved in cell wall biosynthesis
VGSIDERKNCGELFNYFIRYKERTPSRLKLVLMGKEVFHVPKHRDIVSLGFVSDEDKYDGMAGAKILVLPSLFESLSLSVLESMALRVPVIVNGACEVLKGHCVKSNGGLYYKNYYEFEGCLNWMLSHEDSYAKMGDNAHRYVEENYQWDVVVEKFTDIFERVLK